MANTWIKLYHEILTDPKMGRMSDRLFRRTIELFLIAGKEDNDGILPSIEDIAWILRTSDKEIQKTMEDLMNLNIISNSDQGYKITHFRDRQITDLTKSEKNHNYYEKSKNKKTEIQSEFSQNSENIKTEIQKNSEKIQSEFSQNSVEIQTLDKDKDKEEDKDINTHTNVCVSAPEKNPEKPKSKKSRERDRGELKTYGFAKNVLLSDEEYANLKHTVGDGLESLIDDFSVYLGKTPKYGEQYPDHYFDLLSWHRKDVKDRKKAETQKPVQTQNKTAYEMLMERGLV